MREIDKKRDRQAKASTYPTPLPKARCDTMSIFKRINAGLNSEFSFSWADCSNKAKEPSLPYNLPIVKRRMYGFVVSLRETWNT